MFTSLYTGIIYTIYRIVIYRFFVFENIYMHPSVNAYGPWPGRPAHGSVITGRRLPFLLNNMFILYFYNLKKKSIG